MSEEKSTNETPAYKPAAAQRAAMQLMAIVATGISDPGELGDAMREQGVSLKLDGQHVILLVRVLKLAGWVRCHSPLEVDHRIVRRATLISPRPDPMRAGSYARVRVDIACVCEKILTSSAVTRTYHTRLELSELIECEGRAVH